MRRLFEKLATDTLIILKKNNRKFANYFKKVSPHLLQLDAIIQLTNFKIFFFNLCISG